MEASDETTQKRKGNSENEIKEAERQALPVSFCLELASTYDNVLRTVLHSI